MAIDRPWWGKYGLVMEGYCNSKAKRLEDIFVAYVADAAMGRPCFPVEDFDAILEQLIAESWKD